MRTSRCVDYALREVAEKDGGGKFAGTLWVDHKKGSDETPEIRSRLVGQEFAKGEIRDDLFAATPPLTASRLILPSLASRGKKRPGNRRAMPLDVKKAFLYGRLTRTVYIELPMEDAVAKTGKCVGSLRKATCGLRDAPQAWQGEVKRTMEELGFKAAVSTPCAYFNGKSCVRGVAHVDDFLCTGPKDALEKLLADLKEKYQMKVKMLGPGGARSLRASSWGERCDGLKKALSRKGMIS